MILDSTLTHPRGDQTALALHAFNASQARQAFYAHVLALLDVLEPTPCGGLYRSCQRKDGTQIESLAEWVEAVEAGEVER